MEERKIVLDQAIPEDYSMLRITVFNNDILEIAVVKVSNTYCITKYIGYIKSDEIISENFHFNKITYKELEKAEQLANDYLDVIEKWRNRYYDAERKIAELQRQLNALQSTPTPQINNTTSNTEQSFNNNEGIVRVNNISVEGNLRHNNDASNKIRKIK